MDVGQALPRFGGFPHSKRRPARRRDVGSPKSAGGSTHDLTGVFVKPSKETMLFLCLFAAPGPTCKRSCGWLPPVPVRNSRRFKNTPGFLHWYRSTGRDCRPGNVRFSVPTGVGSGESNSRRLFCLLFWSRNRCSSREPSGLASLSSSPFGSA